MRRFHLDSLLLVHHKEDRKTHTHNFDILSSNISDNVQPSNIDIVS